MDILPSLAADLREEQQLEIQRQQDPRVIGPLIQVYEQIVRQLQNLYASIQNNLGLAYHDLQADNHAANLEQAITCFQEALRFWTPDVAPYEYAMIQTHLGTVYNELLTGDRAANAEQAIACYQEALRFLTPESAPFEYALTQNNLGLVYRNLPTGDRATNLAKAIEHYQEALRFRTPEAAPFDYAMTQNNLGNAYSKLSTSDGTKNAAQAIACYQEALHFWTPEAAPSECRTTNRNLGDLHFAQGEWQAALGAYRAAMDVGEQLYRAGLFAESKATEVVRNAALYRHAALAAVRCGAIAEGLLILERGKTRLLTDALRLQIPRPANIPDEVWQVFERAGASVRTTQSERTTLFSEEYDPVQAYTARQLATRDANAALDAAIEQVREYAPEFLQEIDLPTIRALFSDEHTILLAFCITEQGSIGFVVYYNQEVQVKEIPTFTQTELSRLLVEVDAHGIAVGGWLVNHYRFLLEDTQAAFAVWQQTITNTLAVLGQRLLDPILSTLPFDVEQIILLPSAELFLLPLHAVPLLPGDNPEFVCDRYRVSYAPSVEVLAKVQAKVVQVAMPELYAVINPEADPRLIFTLTERSAIARLFTQSQVDEGQTGTKQRVIAEMHGRSYVHFSCHGSYDWNDPTASGLDLADGRLTLAELQGGVANLSSARLVTLSACETGMVDVLQGSAEEYVGIPAGFLLAGVPCVVSSLWAVFDLSTALLMERFYHNHLSGGMDFATALREAQVGVRNLTIGEVAQYAEQSYQQSQQKDKTELYRLIRYYRSQAKQNPTWHPFAHPYYWAAFTVNGM